MRRSLTCLFILALAAMLSPRLYALGGDHPNNYPVKLDRAPEGLNNLINQGNRVHGFFVNAEDRFFYAGDTAAFVEFLKQYAKLEGIAGHRLVVHKGKGRAKSPWDNKLWRGKSCDWMLETWVVSWAELHREVFMDPGIAASETEEPRYLAELHVWTDGNVNLGKLTIPDTVHVTREDQSEAHKKETGNQSLEKPSIPETIPTTREAQPATPKKETANQSAESERK